MPSRPGRDPPLPPLPPLPPILSPSVTAPPSSLPRGLPLAPALDITRKRLPERQNAPTMATMNGSAPTSSRRGHHRSISHPFPFPGLGKRRDKAKANMWESDSDSDEITFPTDTVDGSPRKDSRVGGDLAETKCQTCNSTVRWPRNLKTFRCSACLMVTDLDPEPLNESNPSVNPDAEDRARTGRAKNYPFDDRPLPPLPPSARPPEQKPDMPLSAKYMSDMIDRCLSMYFDKFLDRSKSSPGPDDNRNGRARPSRPEEYSSVTGRGPGGHLSPPRDPRSRSTSGSGERLGVPKNPSTFLTPHVAQWEGKDTPVRTRANSDLQSSPNTDRRTQDRPTHHSDLENKDREAHHGVFERLENYLIASLKGIDVLNTSFSTHQPSVRSASSGNPPRMKMDPKTVLESNLNAAVFEPDAKTLLLGDLAENSSWWMTEWAQAEGHLAPSAREKGNLDSRLVSSRSPRINWAEVGRWHQLLLTAGSSWAERWVAKRPEHIRSDADAARQKRWESVNLAQMEREIIESRVHLQRTFMKAVENLLKRPRRLIKKADDTRWLFILLANPLLSSPGAYSPPRPAKAPPRDGRRPSHPIGGPRPSTRDGKSSHKDHNRYGSTSHHHGVVKRILGLMSNASNECHHHFVSWLSRFSPSQFERMVELIGGFVTYRLTRQHGRKRKEITKDGDELIPSFASAAGNTPAELHAAINNRRSPNKKPEKKKEAPIVYVEDWQIKAGSRILSLLFTANTEGSRRSDVHSRDSRTQRHPNSAAQSGRRDSYMVPISAFYNTLLDYSDLIADFEVWESKGSKFSFCQYPFLLSIWAKIHIMEHDARRQMEVKAREAFFSSILNHRAVSQYLVLKVRRECLVEDSLRAVSESVGAGSEEIKKGLRIEFVGEEGVDAGGLRKEWFLLLVREVFDPYHGLFIYDDDSQYCYFNPYCFESSEQFYLVGVLLGLAIYNSTILDVDLPPFAFRKLLAAAPQNTGLHPSNPHHSKFKCTLDDLAEFRPALAKGLRGLLEFEGDVAETFCYDFVAQVDRYGEVVTVPLCAGGEKRPVTNSNRREFVDMYVRYLLDTAVARQFEPFKRGFFTVCGGNALSLFRSEEIELLVRGSDEPLDVTSLRAVATYDNWSAQRPEAIAAVQWFWDFFESSPPQAQRKILSFVTGSDRIPAMGATSLSIRLACLGDDCSRYPIARTCFNMLGLYRYGSREKLEKLLWDAVVNSEGFGLK